MLARPTHKHSTGAQGKPSMASICTLMKRIFVGFATICSKAKRGGEAPRQEIGKEKCGDGRPVTKVTNTGGRRRKEMEKM